MIVPIVLIFAMGVGMGAWAFFNLFLWLFEGGGVANLAAAAMATAACLFEIAVAISMAIGP